MEIAGRIQSRRDAMFLGHDAPPELESLLEPVPIYISPPPGAGVMLAGVEYPASGAAPAPGATHLLRGENVKGASAHAGYQHPSSLSRAFQRLYRKAPASFSRPEEAESP